MLPAAAHDEVSSRQSRRCSIDHIRAVSLTASSARIYAAPVVGKSQVQAMSIRLTITSTMKQIATEHEVTLPLLSDELVLSDCGLDSLGFAIHVARLEDALGFDPFTASDDVYFPVTLGDFVGVYENAAKKLEAAS